MSIIKILSSKYDRELLRFFIKKELIAPYKGSGFGAFWNVLIPFCIMMIYAFVFGVLFGGQQSAGSISNYVLIVVSGFLFWISFTESLSTGAVAITLNSGYIKKNKFPLNILFLNVVVSGFIKQLILFVIYILMFVYINRTISIGFIFVLPVLVVFMLLCFGFAQILGSITPYFKDIPHIINLLLRLGIYLSCVLYKIEQIPIVDHTMYLYLNPVASCIILGRYFVFGINQEYAFTSVISIICWTVATLIIGHIVVAYVEKDVADVL